MKIELVGATPVKIVQANPVPRQRVGGGAGPSRGPAGGSGGPRRGANRRGGRGPRQPKPVRTAADLDADLDAHNAKMQTD
jgi:hypothetical protein